jgi:hypothetical protein
MSNLFTGLLNMGTGFAGALGEAKKDKYWELLSRLAKKKEKEEEEERKRAEAAGTNPYPAPGGGGRDPKTPPSGGDGQGPKTPPIELPGGGIVKCGLHPRRSFSPWDPIVGPGMDYLPDIRDDHPSLIDLLRRRGRQFPDPYIRSRPRQDPYYRSPVTYAFDNRNNPWEA